MKVLFLGDIVGKSGRDAVISYVESNKDSQKIDFVVVNGENAAHGFGITSKICEQLFDSGVDVITMGNHTFDQRKTVSDFESVKNLIRPLNYPKGTPGQGHVIIEHPVSRKKLLVVNLIGRLGMGELNDDPIQALEKLLESYSLGKNVDAVFVDLHAETTAEKTVIARYFDGRISAMVGTHTHVPTADLQIFQGGTGYLSDSGMCGDYDSIIGMTVETSTSYFMNKANPLKMAPAEKEATVCGVFFETTADGKCSLIRTIRAGGFLLEQTK